MKIKAIGFDVDGTLYPSSQMVFSAVSSFLSAPVLMYNFAKVRREIRQITYDCGLREMQARLMARKMDIDQEEALRRIEKDLYGRWDRSFRHIKPFPGVREVLLSLSNEGYVLGALSDFPLSHKLRYLGVDDLFSVRLSSEDTGYLKPHSVPFLQLARSLGAAPEETLYVGNSGEYDIEGAASVGMKTAHIAKAGKGEKKADFVFQNFFQLRDWIVSGFGKA
ncbi:MAG: HAD family hydrolase [Spirochaetaceae bacterium]